MATSDHRHPSSIAITVQGGSVQVIVDVGKYLGLWTGATPLA
jgi:hypothetical protein